MIGNYPPVLFLLLGMVLLPLFRGRGRAAAFLIFPGLALAQVMLLPEGEWAKIGFLDYTLVLCHVDSLSRLFGGIFSLITLLGGIYAWHIRALREQIAGLGYAAGSLGVTFAGDFFTLLVFWELMAVSSVVLVWNRQRADAAHAGLRYLFFHLFGGSLLLGGIVLHVHHTGDLGVGTLAPGDSPGTWVILAGVAVNAAVIPLHPWLPDAYPKATVTGAVFLSALTTKTAVYALLRIFPGWEILVVLGVLMTLYGVIYAVLVNDIREILAYHIISQVGYMVAGAGIGTPLAVNGAAAHAFCHILYKALLFMGAGAVLHATGRSKLAELGGLKSRLPWTLIFYMIGAFSISGFPLFNGFVSKSIVVESAGEAHILWAKFLLILASVGTFLSVGLKLPYFAWFHSDTSPRLERPLPGNLPVAMGATSALCLFFGLAPETLYVWLPHEMDYHPYTIPHLIEAIQLLAFTFAGFWWLRHELAGKPKLILDVDWFYRRPAPMVRRILVDGVNEGFAWCDRAVSRLAALTARAAYHPGELLALIPSATRLIFEPNQPYSRPLGGSVSLILVVILMLALWGLVAR